MSRRLSPLLALASLVASIPVAAQHLYVPRTSYPGDATALEVVVTNPDPEITRVVTVTLFGEGVDGVSTPGTGTEQIGLVPGGTRVLAVPQGIGLLRLSGYDGLRVSARLRSAAGAAAILGDAVPVLSSASVAAAGATVEVHSLVAAQGLLDDVGIFNGGQEGAQCDARLRRPSGEQLGPDFALALPPLSFNLFHHVPGGLVAGPASEIRLQVHCDRAFHVLSRTVDPATGYVSFQTAATPIAAGLSPPGAPPPPPPPPPPPTGGSPPAATTLERYRRDGEVFTATGGVPSMVLALPVTPDLAFSQLALRFRVKHGGWDPVTPDGVVNIAYLTRGAFTGDVFASITARGPNRYVVRNEINVDLPPGSSISRVAKADLVPGTVYTVDYLYDWPGGRWQLEISDATGPVFNLAGPVSGPVWTEDAPWTLELSQDPGSGHVASLGWTYSDLVVEWRP